MKEPFDLDTPIKELKKASDPSHGFIRYLIKRIEYNEKLIKAQDADIKRLIKISEADFSKVLDRTDDLIKLLKKPRKRKKKDLRK